MNEKRDIIQATAEKFKTLDTAAQQFVLGYMTCWEAMQPHAPQGDETKNQPA